MNLFSNVKQRHSSSLRPNLKRPRWGVKVRNDPWVFWFVAVQACRGDISSQDLFCWSSSRWVSALKIRVMAVPSWELTGRFKRQRQGGLRWEDREGALLRLLMTVEKKWGLFFCRLHALRSLDSGDKDEEEDIWELNRNFSGKSQEWR